MYQRSLHEECGVIAVYAPGRAAATLIHRGLFALQHRGQEAAGIATWTSPGVLGQLKGRGLVPDALPTYEVVKLQGEMGIGHVRYSTVSHDQMENIQPFTAITPYGPFAIAHNGNLKNVDELRVELEKEGSLLSTTMDTELFAHLLARSQEGSFEGALQYVADRVLGAYSLTMLAKDAIYALRDPDGVRPLVLGSIGDGYVVASETCAIDVLGGTFIREIKPGELVKIDADGVHSQQLLTPSEKPSPCVFELVYFGRPDSNLFGRNVHHARTRMGELMASRDKAAGKIEGIDVVVPVPDSGFPAAIGYARASGVPLEKAIIRSHYVGRTFILPDQNSRENSLSLKLSVISEAVKGKRVLLVDDSIVRGNTSRLIVKMVRDAGAAEVHMRIASPPLPWSCYLGIDTPTREELVINRCQGSIEGVRDLVGADDLDYLTLEELQEASGGKNYCFGCMTGEYPV